MNNTLFIRENVYFFIIRYGLRCENKLRVLSKQLGKIIGLKKMTYKQVLPVKKNKEI